MVGRTKARFLQLDGKLPNLALMAASAHHRAISEREYGLRMKMVKPINWAGYRAEGTGEADKFCGASGVCEVRKDPPPIKTFGKGDEKTA